MGRNWHATTSSCSPTFETAALVAHSSCRHIGGPAKAISHIWLLAMTPFQRRRGARRFADISVETADGVARKL